MNEKQTLNSILDIIRWAGFASAGDLQEQLGLSQPTVWRATRAALAGGQILSIGKTRRQVYLQPRGIPGVEMPAPVFRIDEDGRPHEFGSLVALPDDRFYMDEVDGLSRLHPSLPWFLRDTLPQGYMGKTFVRANQGLSLPPNPAHWNATHEVIALARTGCDLPGNLIVGSASFDLFQKMDATTGTGYVTANSPEDYPELARQSIEGVLGVTSSGGEQAKFCVLREGVHRIVKFSTPANDAAGDRARDLLICEHLACKVLEENGVVAATSEIHRVQGRVFLDSHRFDRTARGRVGMVSLLAMESDLIGQMDTWSQTADRLLRGAHISEEDATTMKLAEAFGRLINNTDMHYGNLSFLRQDGHWRLAPIYDMLPMGFMPVQGEIRPSTFDPSSLKPSAATLGVWPEAQTLATEFWARVADDDRITTPFREIAGDMAQALRSVQRQAPERQRS